MSIASKFMYLKAEFDLLVRLSLQFFCSYFDLFCLFRITLLIINDKVYLFENFKVFDYSEKILIQPLKYLKKELISQTASAVLDTLGISFTNTSVFNSHRDHQLQLYFLIFEKMSESLSFITGIFYYF